MGQPLYSVKECEERIVEIDEKIKQYEDIPQAATDGPVSMNFQTRIQQLQKERTKWESRLEEARDHEDSKNGDRRSRLQGPSFELT